MICDASGGLRTAADDLLSLGGVTTAGAPASTRVALVHFGNQGGLGTTRRVAVWRELLAGAGVDVVEVNLLDQHRRRAPSPATAVAALRGVVVPEAAAWSSRGAARAIRSSDADAAVFVTARAFHPELAAAVRTSVLDLQDLFSRSYRGRSMVDRRPGARTAWKLLASVTARFEGRHRRVRTVAAGWSEAREIGAIWIPNTMSASVPYGAITDHSGAPADVLFFGKLGSLPNIDAVRQLAALWPQVASAVPGARCLLAGAAGGGEVRRIAACYGWQLVPDFADVTELCQAARLGVVPLRYANGIQNKVLEAAAAGLPQVVSGQALRGLAPGFPAAVADNPAAAISAVAGLLSSPAHRLDLARQAHAHVTANYSVEHWVEPAHDLVTAAA
ncbi:MAG: glycosyltransferase [Acidimicrobiales bacterium]